jgi:hypothetical protein
MVRVISGSNIEVKFGLHSLTINKYFKANKLILLRRTLEVKFKKENTQ